MEKYKAKIHISIGDYEFLEIEAEGTLDELKLLAQEAKKDEFGLDDKEWREALDRYLTEAKMDSNAYERMSIHQKLIIQEIKKSFKRLNK